MRESGRGPHEEWWALCREGDSSREGWFSIGARILSSLLLGYWGTVFIPVRGIDILVVSSCIRK